MKRSVLISTACIAFILGIVAANFVRPVPWWMSVASIVIVLVASWKAKRIALIFIAMSAILLGVSYVSLWNNMHRGQNVADYIGKHVSITGRVSGESYWNEYGEFVAQLTSVTIDGRPARGTVRVSSLMSNAREGFLISSSGKLYTTKSAADAQLMYADTRVVSTHIPWLVATKLAFVRGLNHALPSPMSEFAAGIVIGNRSALPQSIQDSLNRIGLSHIIAVSGYNLTILIMLAASILGKRWKWLHAIVCIWLIIAFTLITGAAASIVRAAIMSGLFLLTRYYGRRLTSSVAISLTCALTLLLKPSYIMNDLGWQLSFLALAGIVLFTPVIQRHLPSRTPMLSEILATSFAAQVLTVPLIAYKFGQLSLIAPIANILIMPLVPVLMFASLAAGLVGMLLPVFSSILFLPLSLLLRSVLSSINYLASLRYSVLPIVSPNLYNLALYYGVLITAAFITLKTRRHISYNKGTEYV